IRQEGAEQNKVYQSVVVMNGQRTGINRLLKLRIELLQQRQGLAEFTVTADVGHPGSIGI
ncbi:hypothetical protein WQ67_26445, partial [Escherichia coli]